jgi:hypothetical protein
LQYVKVYGCDFQTVAAGWMKQMKTMAVVVVVVMMMM